MTYLKNDVKLPCHHWRLLSTEDQSAFRQLHVHFIQQQKDHIKDRRNNSFFNDVLCLMKYIDYSSIRRDDRAICVGLAFSGPFVCVNTQQLKTILCRCKSSINNGFQQIGYDAVRNKSKSKEAVLAIIPSLIAEQNILRKWTVRCASETSNCCFYSYYRVQKLPFISDEDLYDDKKSVQGSMLVFSQSQARQNNNNIASSNSSLNNLSYYDFDSQKMQPQQPLEQTMQSNLFQQNSFRQQSNLFAQIPVCNQINFMSQASSNNYNCSQSQNQPFILPPMNFNSINKETNERNSNQCKVFSPMNFNQMQDPPQTLNSIAVTPVSPAQEMQSVKSERNFFSNNQDDFIFGESNLIMNDNPSIQSQEFLKKNEIHIQHQQLDSSLFADEEMIIPDITPSFSTNYLTEFGENEDFNLDFGIDDSIFVPSKPQIANNMSFNINIARSQSAFISSIDNFY